MQKISYIIGFLIVAAFVYEIKENEDLEETKASISCLNKPSLLQNPENQKYIDLLWTEVISYLDNYRKTLESHYKQCKSRYASTISYSGSRSQPKECLDKYYDVLLMLKQLKQIVDNKDAAKKCFDPKMTEVEPLSFKGLTPHENMKSFSSVAKWINRDTFKKRYQKDTPVHKQLAEICR